MTDIKNVFIQLEKNQSDVQRRLVRLERVDIPTYTASGVLFSDPTTLLPTTDSALYYNPTTHTLTVSTVAVQSWQTPTLLNSWVNYGSGNPNASYYKDPLGMVHLKGIVKSGAYGTVIFQLPSGYRPAESIYQETLTGNGAPETPTLGVILIGSDGNVYASSGGSAYFSMNGKSFRAS